MAERWQQWMPFHIDRFRGSPDVQAMHPTARAGYIYLLASAWQTDDCTVPNNPFDLASLSGLGDDLWAQYSTRILRKFEVIEGGTKLQNHVEFAEWKDAKRVYDARRKSAVRTTEIRSPKNKQTVTVDNHDGHRTVTDGEPSRSADTQTQTITGTVTTTKEQEQVPPAQAKPSRGKKSEEVKTRHAEFKAVILRYWEKKNPEIEMPWGPAEGRNLAMWLKESPNTTVEQFTRWMANRFNSKVVHTERPSRWIGNITSFANGPLNEFGKPLNGGNSNGRSNDPRTVTQSIEDVIGRARAGTGINGGSVRSPQQSPNGSDVGNICFDAFVGSESRAGEKPDPKVIEGMPLLAKCG